MHADLVIQIYRALSYIVWIPLTISHEHEADSSSYTHLHSYIHLSHEIRFAEAYGCYAQSCDRPSRAPQSHDYRRSSEVDDPPKARNEKGVHAVAVAECSGHIA